MKYKIKSLTATERLEQNESEVREMAMRVTQGNAKAAVEIMKVLEENKCTAADIPGIFSYVEMKIRDVTTVPSLDYEKILQELTSGLEN